MTSSDSYCHRMNAPLDATAGHTMRVLRTEEEYTRSGFRSDSTVMTCDHCDGCPFKDKGNRTKSKRGEIHRKLGNIREERKAKTRLNLPANQEKLKRRSLEPESVFEQLKYNHGTLASVTSENPRSKWISDLFSWHLTS